MSRKETILEAATALFARKGFSSTPTSTIAREAGVAEGLVFHYFKSKKGILLCILEDVVERYLSGCRARFENCPTGLDAVKALIGFHFEFGSENTDALLVLIRDVPSSFSRNSAPPDQDTAYGIHRIICIWEECIDRGRRDGSLSHDLSPRETAFVIQGMLIGISRLKFMTSLEASCLSTQATEFCLRALRPRKKNEQTISKQENGKGYNK
ncbi:putative Transcriptional regulator, TetR family [uncultured Desulfatiglans sp.]|uniref:Putative Transcriptional regulator, TetR family n=1 Tax=Uncultured Desulfatiglans sp. TaxID=1748965 RepID=A0A653AKD2_UNCDX|nr:putative Transcriptional regulator, TetR family [uncultured Desulfatiglans sp.]